MPKQGPSASVAKVQVEGTSQKTGNAMTSHQKAGMGMQPPRARGTRKSSPKKDLAGDLYVDEDSPEGDAILIELARAAEKKGFIGLERSEKLMERCSGAES